MMSAFLSHSSKDKDTVDQVARLLGGASVVLDSISFDQGITNIRAVREGLKRADLFVLFLTDAAIASNIVRFEALLAEELVAQGIIQQFLVFCLDEGAFSKAEEFWKSFNFVRKAVSPQSIARVIQEKLMLNRPMLQLPFVGRDNETTQIRDELGKPSSRKINGFYISGNYGIGRRTFVKKIYRDFFLSVSQNSPDISVERFDGPEEIYRKINEQMDPFATFSQRRVRYSSFASARFEEKCRLISLTLDNFLTAREYLLVYDAGGLLKIDGSFQPVFKSIVSLANNYPHPPLVFVAERMVPRAHRQNDRLVYCAVESMSRTEVRKLLSIALNRINIDYEEAEIEKLIEISDNSPLNIGFIVDSIKEYGIDIFLANPNYYHILKQKHSQEFISSIDFDKNQIDIMKALKSFRSLNFESIAEIVREDLGVVAGALSSLIDLHVIEIFGRVYNISPRMQSAVERDSRFNVTAVQRRAICEAIISLSKTIDENDRHQFATVEAGIIATLRSKKELAPQYEVFLLPSHLLWLGQQYYYDKNYEDSIAFAKKIPRRQKQTFFGWKDRSVALDMLVCYSPFQAAAV